MGGLWRPPANTFVLGERRKKKKREQALWAGTPVRSTPHSLHDLAGCAFFMSCNLQLYPSLLPVYF